MTKAEIPVAGLGTRLLPATKSQPKEMLTIGRKPTVQYIVEELATCGLKDIGFIIRPRKHAIKHHFDPDEALEELLEKKGQSELASDVRFHQKGLRFSYHPQEVPRGSGDAILQAKEFVGQESFAVALGDAIIYDPEGGVPFLRQMMSLHMRLKAAAVLAVEPVEKKEVFRYGVIDPEPTRHPGVLRIRRLVEKPTPEEAPSNLVSAARYTFSPAIFEALEQIPVGKGGELQLTDAIEWLINQGKPVYAMVLGEGQKRYDIGNFESYYKAFVDFALRDETHGQALRQYLRKLLRQK
jgi:UTP--glucose-1-phosphate uridylyltransferase